MDGLYIVDISELPEGTPLEQALCVRKKRSWSPFVECGGSTASTPSSKSLISPKKRPRSLGEYDRSLISPKKSPRSLGECDGTPKQRPRPRHPRPLRDAEMLNHKINYGSEHDSDSDDNEGDDKVAASFIPKIFKEMMDTPEDQEDNNRLPTFVDIATEFLPPLRVASPNSFVSCPFPSDIVQPLSPSLDIVPPVGIVPSPNHQQHNPAGMYEFHWKTFPDPPISPELRRESFVQKNVGPTTPFVDPYDAFIAIWDHQFMENIALETNRYAQQLAQQMFATNTLRPDSRICKWVETTTDELYTYFGIVLAMGILVKTRIDEYWCSNVNIFYTPGFSAHMSLRRFQLLSKCLHFNNNENMCVQELDASEAKLYKIQPLLSHLNQKFQSMMNLRQNIALDESLLQWKGWLDINQFIPNKAASVGIKTYEICESQTGYLWRFEVHAHKKVPRSQQSPDPLDASTPSIVLRLIQGLEHKGHTLWMDNFYNSPALARKLKTLGFDCVGTLRTNRQFVPETLKNLSKLNMQPGQITGLTSGDVDLMVWRDQNRVATISTYHGNFTTNINGTVKPILIHDYNIMMGGVDKKDQVLAMYPIERKRTNVWYKKLFQRLLNVSVLNSFIIVKQNNPMTHRAFRMSLIESLLKMHGSATITPLTTSPTKSIVFEAKKHYIAEYPFTTRGSSRLRRKCCLCPRKVHFYCVGCDKTVCMFPCFVSLHK